MSITQDATMIAETNLSDLAQEIMSGRRSFDEYIVDIQYENNRGTRSAGIWVAYIAGKKINAVVHAGDLAFRTKQEICHNVAMKLKDMARRGL
jgi:hypothetical protein